MENFESTSSMGEQNSVMTGANSQDNANIDLSMITVVKRNGSLVPFRRDRIVNAVEGAMRATHSVPTTTPLSPELHSELQLVADKVLLSALEKTQSGQSLTVEGIQDLVEVSLMSCGHHDIARDYIVYRDQHKKLRQDSPRNIKILRRDGREVRLNPMKIAEALEKCFRSTNNIAGPTPSETIRSINLLTNKVVLGIAEMNRQGTSVHIELIQDEVEKQLMAEGYYQEAKDYIIYRATRSQNRQESAAAVVASPAQPVVEAVVPTQAVETGEIFKVYDANGNEGTVSERDIRTRIEYACTDLKVDSAEIFQDTVRNFYQGIKLTEVDQATIMSARAKVEKDPEYSFVTARLLLDQIYRETIDTAASDASLTETHQQYFKQYIAKGIEYGRLTAQLAEFDLDRLAQAIDLSRDLQFTYLGLQTIYDRYLVHHENVRIETPQIFWMRVAMGLALNETPDATARAIEFYDLLSQFYFVSSTPTLFNSGTCHSQMSSCYLSTVQDDLKSIFKLVADDAQLSKWAGGLGNDWTNVRATGSVIKGTNGRSQGVVPFLKVANDTAVAVNQGGKRKGAMCAYLETWHLDLEDFLELRKNTGDERRRTHDMNTANWIPDLFMKRVAENGSWTMFSPSDVPDLHDLYGKEFEERYTQYEKMCDAGEIKLYRRIEAVDLWRKMLSMLFETGHPWITFKDPSNLRSPQDHVGVVHSSNLCTEILLNTSDTETAVCNLGSVNMVNHMSESGELMEDLLAKNIKTAIRLSLIHI